MHIADPDLGVYGANSIVGAGLPIAVGAATAARLRQSGKVAVAFFGDGAVAQGAFHESVNLAAVWDLAVIFFCENNHYAQFSSALSQSRGSLEGRAAGYGVDYVRADGNDFVSVAETMGDVLARMRDQPRPVLVEAETYRCHGHYERLGAPPGTERGQRMEGQGPPPGTAPQDRGGRGGRVPG
jgi:2-oxoisovalerate dehydrogenase E1 component